MLLMPVPAAAQTTTNIKTRDNVGRPAPVGRDEYRQGALRSGPPITLDELTDRRRKNRMKADGESEALPLDIRRDAQEAAALSYGARGGLAYRTWHIRREIETRARYLDKVYDFRQLLIPAQSGLLIEPPVVSEALDALLIANRGNEAAVADKVLRINRNARIVSTPRNWRTYLERQWGDIEPPPDVLLPQSPVEIALWEEAVTEGWARGIEQADEIFQADLNQLTADYEGMIRYKNLLAQNMISPPYALQTDRGITGDGTVMRIGDRAVEITRPAALQTNSDVWQPVNR